VLNGCKEKNELESLKLFSQIDSLKNHNLLYIIPGSGCTGCISEIETLAINNVTEPHKYFLFTRIKSVKLFKNRFGQDFISRKNVILDTSNLFKFPANCKDIYPLLLTCIKGELEVVKSFKP
jgi:hypothetical protein